MGVKGNHSPCGVAEPRFVLSISYGGLLKEIHKEFQLGDAVDGDLIHIDEDSDEVANGAIDVMAYWHVGLNNYVIKKV